jgi:hypothetical protein
MALSLTNLTANAAAGVARHLRRLRGAAGLPHQSDLPGIDLLVVLAAFAGVFLRDPLDAIA